MNKAVISANHTALSWVTTTTISSGSLWVEALPLRYYLERTDPKLVHMEMDIFWVPFVPGRSDQNIRKT